METPSLGSEGAESPPTPSRLLGSSGKGGAGGGMASVESGRVARRLGKRGPVGAADSSGFRHQFVPRWVSCFILQVSVYNCAQWGRSLRLKGDPRHTHDTVGPAHRQGSPGAGARVVLTQGQAGTGSGRDPACPLGCPTAGQPRVPRGLAVLSSPLGEIDADATPGFFRSHFCSFPAH